MPSLPDVGRIMRDSLADFTMEIRALDVPLRVDDGGTVRVGATRVRLDSVVLCYDQGDTPEAIQDAFSTLTLPDIYATITYVLQHREQVDAYLAWQDARAEKIQAEILAHDDQSDIWERVEAYEREQAETSQPEDTSQPEAREASPRRPSEAA
jgi:uncharacterized protein (DUF433 family)